ncbi:thioester reductase domain-containing protein [Desulfosporosinus hippei]|uniref:Amino acid adenylation domain-containing protein/thioester reductase domain-containing protein n=1 Tax=Desulfosporosinus hippei DSM 8344 TaxID=1121419 RepID=A0A1G7UDU4_9FIRM|nr:thioester reductase domain-containing protein [Desulfosporosinus hippei]SDG45461.1 amino acid adenylation domain-containing protein/thioester reductase domain-containing protein [Desulfosporosinus hippei DSM 8344]
MKKEINIYPLTSAQKSISIIEKFYPNPSYVNLGITIRFKSQLDYHLLNNAINLVIMQNDALRTRLKNDSNEIVQYFPEYNEHPIELLDFSYNKGLEDYYQWAQDVTARAFQFYDSDLCYFAILKFSNNESGLFIKCHHIIVDFWAIILLVNKIVKNLNSAVNEVGLEINEPSYVEYIKKEARYLSSSRFFTDRDYWQQKIKALPDTNLFMKRGTSGLEARRKSYRIPLEISSRINEVCNQHKISPFIFFCSVLSIYFWKKEDREQIVIGTTILNRTTLKEKNTIGAFFNNLPFIVDVDPSLSFKDYLNYLNIEWLTMLRYSSYPYVHILKQFRKTQNINDNLFDFTLTFLNANLDSGQIEFELEAHFNGQEVNALRVNINELKSIGLFHLDYDYSTDVLKEAEIEDINRSLVNLIQDGIKYPNKSVGNLNMLSDSEQQLVLSIFNQTEMEFQPEKTIIQLFEETVRKIPEKIALVFENNQLTYQELNNRSNKLARFLLKKGVAKEEIVGFSVERSFDLVVGILGILKSGAAYLPIDPSYPRERIEHMLRDSNCRFLLTNCSNYNHLMTEVEVIDLSNSEIWEGTTDDLVCTLRPNDLAYLIYTSGSTGTPKGVMIEHRAISNFVHSITKEIDFTYKTIISITTLSFDIFFMETLFPLIAGLKVIIANNEELASPHLLSDLIVRYQVDVLQATPARLNIMLNSSTCLNELSLIMVGGEVFPQSLLSRLKKITKAQIYNMYGPTETTIWSSTKRLDDADQLTIGRPIGNTKFYILDKYQTPVPIGMLGEIFIAGEGVARGYLNRPELTSEKFLSNPFFPGTRMYKTGDLGKWLENGEIEYIGRNDKQVKIRGFRIELSEIEECLLKNEDIKQAVVTTYQHLDRALLCAFLVGSVELPVSELRQHMLGYLPEYMIPNRFIWLPALPLTSNGKVDRKSLPNPNWSEDDKANEYVAPRDGIEQRMADIWSKALNVIKIGIDDNFFELGGDSLAILEILSSSLSEAWKISAQEFYEHPTIRSLSLGIKERGYITHQNKKASVYANQIPNYFEVLNRYIVQGEVNTGGILLTGATGFLGIHILKELLNNQLVKVYCIVRGADFERRFRDLLYFYFPQASSELINQRIILVNGDISKKRFGLSSEEYQELVRNVTAVIHAAAMVKHYGSYSDFERINVKGTQEIVDFCHKNDLHLSFISTTSVSGNYMSEKVLIKDFTENDLNIGQDYKSNVYVRSKFEAESLILEEVEKGLKATIFRVGILTGRISDGQFQVNIEENAFYRKLKSIFTIRLIPENLLEEYIEFTPVDSCAKAIISILQSSSPKLLIFHLFNHKTIRVKSFLKTLEFYGLYIKCISLNEYTEAIISLSKSENEQVAINGIVTDLIMKGTLTLTPSFNVNSLKTINYLKNLGFEWPDLTHEYLGKIIENMKQVGYLHKSPLSAKSKFE